MQNYFKEDDMKGYKESCKAYNRTFTATQQDIHRYLKLQNYLKRLYLDTSIKNCFSPSTNLILNTLPSLPFVPALLQAWTLCRFNELKQIDINIIKKSKPITIISSKSDHCRTIDPFPITNPNQLRLLSSLTRLLVISYTQYKKAIIAAKNNINFPKKTGVLDATHIFRHLEATWLYKEKIPVEDISYRLGHINNETTLKYIHSNWEV